MAISNETTFQAAVPYAAGALGVSVVGAVGALVATGVVLQVAGVAAAIFGAYAFAAIVVCGVENSGKPDQFRDEVPKYITTAFGAAIAEICTQVAKQVLAKLVNDALYGRRA